MSPDLDLKGTIEIREAKLGGILQHSIDGDSRFVYKYWKIIIHVETILLYIHVCLGARLL